MVVATQFTTSTDELFLLRQRISGNLITPDSVEYDEVRKVQNVAFDRYPFAIVRAANAIDVAEAVTFARQRSITVAVRSGGHSLAGHSMEDDVLVIDLSAMKRMIVDPVNRVARIQGGVTSGDLAEEAGKHGLAITTGDTSSVGFGGLTTGGGIGFMVRKYGLTIDSLISAEVVTASGDILVVSEIAHADLFWAIRGGGGNFGIVTEFTLRLAPVAQILGGDLILPASRDVLRGYLEYTASAPDDLSTIANLMHAPPAPFIPEDMVGKLVLSILVCWSGALEEGERALAPLRALAEPIADVVRPMPYSDIYLSTAHQAYPHGAAIRSMFAKELSDEALDAMLHGIEVSSSPFSIVHLRGLGGEMGRVSKDATAFAHRDVRYLVAILGLWLDPTEDNAPHRAWVESVWKTIRHEGTGVYVNFMHREGEDRVHEAYPPATYARLSEIKRAYDPENVFRLNQNIIPAPETGNCGCV